MITIKSNEQLFNKWQSLGYMIRNQATIVQNDMTIEQAEYQEFLQQCNEYRKQFEDLIAQTQLWVEYREEVEDKISTLKKQQFWNDDIPF